MIFNSINLIMPHQFIQNKFIQEFMIISLLINKTTKRKSLRLLVTAKAVWLQLRNGSRNYMPIFLDSRVYRLPKEAKSEENKFWQIN